MNWDANPKLVNRRDVLSSVARATITGLLWRVEAGSASDLFAAESDEAGRDTVLAYRVFPVQWKTDKQFDRLLALLSRHRSAVDEVSFFDEMFPRPAGGVGG